MLVYVYISESLVHSVSAWLSEEVHTFTDIHPPVLGTYFFTNSSIRLESAENLANSRPRSGERSIGKMRQP